MVAYRYRVVAPLLAAAALLPPTVAYADAGGWKHEFDAPSSEALVIQAVRPLPEGGYAVIGRVPGRNLVHQRFDPQGAAQGPARIGLPAQLYSPGTVLPDVVLHEQSGPFITRPLPPLLPCKREDHGGFESRDYPEDYSYAHHHGQLDAEGGGFGYGWIQPSRVFRHAADCTLTDFSRVPFGIRAMRNSSTAVLAYAAATDQPHASFPVQTLLVFDRDGLSLSRTFELDGETLVDLTLLHEIDGDVIVGGSGTGRGALFRVGPQGQVRWQSVVDGPTYFNFVRSHPHRDGLMVYAASAGGVDRGPYRLLQLDLQSGALQARARIDHAHWVRAVHAPAPQGEALLLQRFLPGNDLVKVSADGQVETLRAVPFGYSPQLWLDDQSVLVSRSVVQEIAGIGTTEIGIDLWRMNLTEGAAPQRLDDIELAWPVRLDAAAVDGGDSDIAFWQHGRIVMQAFDAAGATRWQTALPTHDDAGGDPTKPLAQSVLRGAGYSCLHLFRPGIVLSSVTVQPGESSLSCLRSSDGALQFAHFDLNDPEDPRRRVRPLAILQGSDGGVAVLVRNFELVQCAPCDNRIEQIDIGNDGSIHRRVRITDSEQLRHTVLATRDDELLLLASEAGARRVMRVAVDDTTQDYGPLPPSWDGLTPIIATLHTDGSIRLLGSTELGLRLLTLGADGQLLHDLTLDGRLAGTPTTQVFVSHAGGAVLVTDVDGRLQLHRVERDGTPRWVRDIGSASNDRVRGLFLSRQDASDAGVRVASVRAARMLLRGFDDVDGADAGFTTAALSRRTDDPMLPLPFNAETADSIVGAPGWSEEGALLYAEHGAAPLLGQPQPPRLQRIELPAPEWLPPARPALTGFWYDPGSSGEGLYLEHFTAERLIGGAWMTYTVDGGTDRAAQRWYSLAGAAGTSDDAVSLTILRSSGGEFGTPPAIDAEAVGTATLRRLDCGRAQLDYQFDAGTIETVAGTLTLVALVPGSGCTYTPPALTTGAWYAAEFPGQGLLLQAFGGSAGDAQLGGAWFTFDVAGQADDPTAQHWFTLLGARDNATLGGYELQLMRTIGGRFDGPSTENRIRVGSAQFELQSCDRATLDYRFDASGAAAEFAAAQGRIALQRAGACHSQE